MSNRLAETLNVLVFFAFVPGLPVTIFGMWRMMTWLGV